MTAGVPIRRRSAASSRTTTVCGGSGLSRIVCLSNRATTICSAGSSLAPAARNSARAYSAVCNNPGISISDHSWSVCASRSGDLELLVAEVGDEFQGAAEGGDVAVQDVLGGDVAAFDLGYPGDRDAHPGGYLLL